MAPPPLFSGVPLIGALESARAPLPLKLCSDLLTPDTFTGENNRHKEVSMSRQRRTFTFEFKREAASLVLDRGYSIPIQHSRLGWLSRPRAGGSTSSQ